MELKPVRDLADQVRGVTYAKDDASAVLLPGSVAVVRAGNIQDFDIELEDLVYVPRERVSDDQFVRKNDVLVAASSGSLDVVGKAARARKDLGVAFGAFCKVLRPRPGVEPRYFAYFFRTAQYRRTVSRLAAGVNINNLRSDHLGDLLVPLPNAGEQARIADILDRAHSVRRKRREAVVLTESLLRATYFEWFGDPATNPKSWPVKPFGSLVQSTQLGLVRAASAQGETRQFPYVRMNAIRSDGHLDLEHVTRVDASPAEVESARLLDGDFLFNTRNSRELVGKAAVFRGSSLYLFNNNIMRVRFVPGVEPDLVCSYWQTAFAQRQLDSRKAGTTSVFAIYYKNLATLPVPVPPPDLQRRYAQFCQAVRKILHTQNSMRSESDRLLDTVVERAFEGEL